MNRTARSALSAIIIAGLVAGTVDIGAAALINALNPVVILHAIASGLLGKASFRGGTATALLGLVLQWGMSIVIAAIYVAVTAARPVMRRRWLASGVAAGVVIFLVMNYLVVPLSAAPFRPRFTLHGFAAAFKADKCIENLLAMIIFGMIIAYVMRGTGQRARG
jgi:uncharacterized membrane protein YagU involved in acid resistance